MGKGGGRRGPDNQADFERLKRLEEGPPEKTYKGPEYQRGLAGVLTGADDPRANQPGYMAICFAIFMCLACMTAIVLCTQQNYWFNANTGAHVGLRHMVVKNWYCGDSEECGYITQEHDGDDWWLGGIVMYACCVLTCLILMVATCLHCINIGEDTSRKNGIFACVAIDLAIVVMLGGLGGYWYVTKQVREDKTPDKNGVITTWTIGANFLGCGLSVVLMLAGAIASMVAKPEVEDEGMEAAMELTAPEPEKKTMLREQVRPEPGKWAGRYGQ